MTKDDQLRSIPASLTSSLSFPHQPAVADNQPTLFFFAGSHYADGPGIFPTSPFQLPNPGEREPYDHRHLDSELDSSLRPAVTLNDDMIIHSHLIKNRAMLAGALTPCNLDCWVRNWKPTEQVNSKHLAPLWLSGHPDPKKTILRQSADRSG